MASFAVLVCSALAFRATGESQSSRAASPQAVEIAANRLSSDPEITNQDVVGMTRAGLSSSVIEEKIARGPCRFDTSAESLQALRSAGVTNSVLSAMIRSHALSATRKNPRVWIGTSDERSFEVSRVTLGGGGVRDTSTEGDAAHKTRFAYADVTRMMSERCPGVTITSKLPDSDYTVTLERYHAGHLITARNDFTIFRQADGELVVSDKARLLKDAVDQICGAVLRDLSLEASSTH